MPADDDVLVYSAGSSSSLSSHGICLLLLFLIVRVLRDEDMYEYYYSTRSKRKNYVIIQTDLQGGREGVVLFVAVGHFGNSWTRLDVYL